MDVVPDGKDFLSEFINSLDTEEEEKVVEREQSTKVDSSNIVSPTPEVHQTNIWGDIEEALHRWTERILDAESRYEKTASFREHLEASLRRQQLDGFLNYQDIAELRHVANLWINLLNCTSSYTIGCEFVKRDIITYLLELYNLRQIDECLFIETCLNL